MRLQLERLKVFVENYDFGMDPDSNLFIAGGLVDGSINEDGSDPKIEKFVVAWKHDIDSDYYEEMDITKIILGNPGKRQVVADILGDALTMIYEQWVRTNVDEVKAEAKGDHQLDCYKGA